jgi:hypothetical protein
MSLAFLLAALSVASPAAQDLPVATAAPSAAEAAQRGVIPYPHSFFAEARPNTALDMIARLPGFQLNQGDDVRGFAGAAGNVLINGERPTSKSEGLENTLQRISATAVERIDLIRGGAPGIDMQGRTVMANVILKRTVQVEKVLDIQTYAYGDGYLGPIVDYRYSRREGVNELEFSTHATRDRTDNTYDGGFRTRRNGAGVLTEDADLKGYDTFENYALRGALQRAAPGGKFKINGRIEYFGFDRTVAVARTFPSPRYEESQELLDNLHAEFGARYDTRVGRNDLQLIFLQNLNDEDYASTLVQPGFGAEYGARTKSGETILRAEARQKRSDSLSFEASLEGAYNYLDGDTRYAENAVPIALPSAKVKVEELRGEASGKAVWRANPKLTVEAGARLELSSISQSGDADLSKDFFYPKPRVMLTWSPNKQDQIRLRLEREVGQLDFGDFVSQAGVADGTFDGADADLVPSRAWAAELAWERRFWEAGSLTATLTHSAISDVTDFKPVPGGFDAPSNIGDGTTDQFVINLTVPTARLGVSGGQLRARLSWVESEVTDPVTLKTRRQSNQAPFVCNVRFTRDMPGGKWSWGVNANCPVTQRAYRINEIRTVDIDPWIETFIEWKPRPDLSLRAEALNLTARERTRTRQIWSGDRKTGTLVQVEERMSPFEPFLWLKLRKTFS